MCPEKNEIELYGRCTDVVSRSAERCVYRLGSADGEALLTVYPVFPGIEIGYYDVHASLRVADGAQRSGLIEICHCREGRIEYQSGDEFFSSPRATCPSPCTTPPAEMSRSRPGITMAYPS